MKSINTIKKLVKQQLQEIDGGIMDPNMAPFVPHRMGAGEPSVDPVDSPVEEEASKLYDIALEAREATERLIVALDNPIFDTAYEDAFKATNCLRRVLNSLLDMGASPDPEQRVVAPDTIKQDYSNIENYKAPKFAGGTAV